MASPHLDITHLLGSQSNKETTVNAAIDRFDNAMNKVLAIAITGDYVPSNTHFRETFLWSLTGTPGSPFLLSVPDDINRLFAVWNATDATCTVQVQNEGTDGVDVGIGETVILHSNGDTIIRYGSGGSNTDAGYPYDIAAFVVDRPEDDEITLQMVCVRPFRIFANFDGSQAKSGVAATAEVSFSIQKNSSVIGVATFASAASTGTFVNVGAAGAKDFAVGDLLRITAPEYQDDTLADVSISLKAITT